MQMRMAATLPSSASRAARLAMFSAAPSSRFCTMLVARLREPGGRPAGFPLWPFRNWGILLTPLLVLRFGVRGGGGQKTLAFGPPALGPKKTRRFWGAPRPRNEKPGAVSRAGLGHTPEGYLFIHESRFNVQKSQVAQRSQVAPRIVVFGIPRSICWAPNMGVRPMKNPARFPGPAWTHFSSGLFCT